MTQITTGLRAALSSAGAYSLLQRLVGARRSRAALAREHIRAQAGDRVLDIGCGTGEILEFLPEVRYFGFDHNPAYIASATARFGSRGTFRCEDVNAASVGGMEAFDLVLAIGILHHLDDEEARGLFRLAASALKPGGRLVTFDSCFEDGQSSIARHLILKDRGQNTRTEAGYVALASGTFRKVESRVRHDLLRVPYTHIILDCAGPESME